MAELKQILSIDTTPGVDSLARLRTEIKELKGQLEKLEIGSKEYEETSDRLWAKQTRLSEVMKEAKRPIEDAAGSYYALNKELVELRKTYKSLSEAERNSDFGSDILLRIQSLDKSLKDLDAAQGQYFRNVGNYANSIVEAFGKMGTPLSKVGGTLGIVINDVKMLVPIIKQVNSTALTGLTGIKGAIAATGIGLLIVAVGELAAHWEDVWEWVKKATVAQDGYADALARTSTAIDKLSLKIAEFNKDADEVEKQRKILFEGYTEVTFAEERLKKATDAQKNASDQLNTALEQQRIAYDKISAATDKIGKGDVTRGTLEYRNAQKELESALTNVAKAQKNVQDATDGVTTSTQNLENARKKETDSLKKNTDARNEAVKKMEEEKKAAEALRKSAEQIISQVNEEQMTSMEKSVRNQQRDMDILERAYSQGLISYEDYQRTLSGLANKYRKERNDIVEQGLKETADAVERGKKEVQDKARKAYDEQIAELEFRLKNSDTGTEASIWDTEARNTQYDTDLENFRTYVNDRIALNEELMQNYSEDSEEYKKLDRENSQLRIDLMNKEKETAAKKSADDKKLSKIKQETVKQEVALTTGMLKNLSAAMGESTKMGKGFAIAAATIDTIAAAVSGFRAGMNQWADAGPMAWMAPVQAAINATAALVAGFAQVQKIQSVDTSGNASASGGGATALAMPNIEGLSSPVDYTRQVTTETEREEMNRDNRVYILESDIQQSNNRVKVREEETTF